MRRFNYTGVADEIPRDATHVTVDESDPSESFLQMHSLTSPMSRKSSVMKMLKRLGDGHSINA